MLKIITAIAVTAWTWMYCADSSAAQAFNPTINPTNPAIVVSTQPEKAPIRPKVEYQKLINIAFGATANGGNTKSYGGNLGGRFGYIRENHQLMVEALGTLSGARQGKLTAVDWTSRNVTARVRYDLFLSQYDALFVAIAPRRDRFAGLDLRLQNQLGYLRNLYYPSDAHRVWGEFGYDLTYDNVGPLEGQPTMTAPAPTSAGKCDEDERDDTCLVHSARLFLGYTNRISPTANLSLGIENLLEPANLGNYRMNGLIELTSSITQTFKLGVQSRVLYDREPVQPAKKFDVVAVAQLVYTFDSLAGTVVGGCPACDCTAQVAAARAACRVPEPSPAPSTPSAAPLVPTAP
jgi:putative salt-induced outer membrane protein YdiY